MTSDLQNGMDALASTFRTEAAELLVELETSLLELEGQLDDTELLARAFRALHTIKGSGAMFGFDDLVTVAHALETAFDAARSGKIAVTQPLVALAISGKDLLQTLLSDGATDPVVRDASRRIVEGALRFGAPAAAPAAKVASAKAPARAKAAKGPTHIYRILFRPQPGLLQDGTNPLGLWNELRDLGRCEVIAHTGAIPALSELEPERCYVAWDAILETEKDANAIRDVFVFVEDKAELRIDLIDDGRDSSEDEVDYKRLGEILLERQDITSADLERTLRERPRIGELLEKEAHVAPEAIAAAALEQQVVRDARAARAGAKTQEGSSVRVAAEKLDSLVDLVGELVIAQARLSALAAQRDDLELAAVSENIDRLSADLRDNALNLRMVPIGTTFSRFRRLVRDLAGELGKEIELVTEGAETELDKTVIERLADPLVHLIRNSCDHGIEMPDERSAAGKAPTGKVRLAAYQSGPSVVIEIQDDGHGLSADKLRAKAVANGTIAADATLTDAEAYQLVFQAGLSTAEKLSNVSGRGVGMDVVKRSVETLRGTIEIESTFGKGTTIRVRLPLTLAIIEGLLVAVGEGRYVLPMSVVEECVEITRADVERAHGSHVAPVRGELVPYLRLREWFGETGERPAIEQIAIATAQGQRFGFVVDDVIGQHQTVIKALGRMYRDVKGLSGATILGDGTVALIVDVAGVIRSVTASAA